MSHVVWCRWELVSHHVQWFTVRALHLMDQTGALPYNMHYRVPCTTVYPSPCTLHYRISLTCCIAFFLDLISSHRIVSHRIVSYRIVPYRTVSVCVPGSTEGPVVFTLRGWARHGSVRYETANGHWSAGMGVWTWLWCETVDKGRGERHSHSHSHISGADCCLTNHSQPSPNHSIQSRITCSG